MTSISESLHEFSCFIYATRVFLTSFTQSVKAGSDLVTASKDSNKRASSAFQRPSQFAMVFTSLAMRIPWPRKAWMKTKEQI